MKHPCSCLHKQGYYKITNMGVPFDLKHKNIVRMKTNKIQISVLAYILVIVTAISLSVVSCSGRATKHEAVEYKVKSTVQEYYTCSMHPEIRSDKPGKCPKCGMELVKADGTADSTQESHTDSVLKK